MTTKQVNKWLNRVSIGIAFAVALATLAMSVAAVVTGSAVLGCVAGLMSPTCFIAWQMCD